MYLMDEGSAAPPRYPTDGTGVTIPYTAPLTVALAHTDPHALRAEHGPVGGSVFHTRDVILWDAYSRVAVLRSHEASDQLMLLVRHRRGRTP